MWFNLIHLGVVCIRDASCWWSLLQQLTDDDYCCYLLLLLTRTRLITNTVNVLHLCGRTLRIIFLLLILYLNFSYWNKCATFSCFFQCYVIVLWNCPNSSASFWKITIGKQTGSLTMLYWTKCLLCFIFSTICYEIIAIYKQKKQIFYFMVTCRWVTHVYSTYLISYRA